MFQGKVLSLLYQLFQLTTMIFGKNAKSFLYWKVFKSKPTLDGSLHLG